MTTVVVAMFCNCSLSASVLVFPVEGMAKKQMGMGKMGQELGNGEGREGQVKQWKRVDIPSEGVVGDGVTSTVVVVVGDVAVSTLSVMTVVMMVWDIARPAKARTSTERILFVVVY
jgi:hypothetical protein